ncbi:hypothetical protein N657DRAFT_679309 [Parathielavia appendiculata]|uniref:Uncharacterized protein n=1 Tax=Parathielavia appendiculata TaxID=2587402 RepID=A0AAN6U4L6_9PEZI|nr:hypothetical protein N657DRAFT_679309 [Parathielavia appendiculata]
MLAARPRRCQLRAIPLPNSAINTDHAIDISNPRSTDISAAYSRMAKLRAPMIKHIAIIQCRRLFRLLIYRDLIPWSWHVAPSRSPPSNSTPPAQCPNRATILASYAVINALTLWFTIMLGRRTVVHYLTRGWLGSLGSPWWPVSAVLATGLTIGQTLSQRTLSAGRARVRATRPRAELALLWLCRQRIAWVAVLLAKWRLEEGMYVGVAASATLQETIVQALGLGYMGMTVDWGRTLGLYEVRNGGLWEVVREEWRGPARIMYAGAMLWMASVLVRAFEGGGVKGVKGVTTVNEGFGGHLKDLWQAMKEYMRRGVFRRFAETMPPLEVAIDMLRSQGLVAPSSCAHGVPQMAGMIENRDEARQVEAISQEQAKGETECVPEDQHSSGPYAWLFGMGLSLAGILPSKRVATHRHMGCWVGDILVHPWWAPLDTSDFGFMESLNKRSVYER